MFGGTPEALLLLTISRQHKLRVERKGCKAGVGGVGGVRTQKV